MLQNSDNCVSLFCSVNGSDLDPEEPIKVEEPAPTKKPPKEQRSIKEMPFIQFSVIHTVKGFGIINKAEIDVFLFRFCFF